MTSTSEAKRAVKETIEKLGGLDIILSNAVHTPFPLIHVPLYLPRHTDSNDRDGRGFRSGRILRV